jgi:hypothetical protein
MSTLWLLIILLAIVKLPLIALMMWMPFRAEAKQMKAEAEAADDSSADEDDGGSKILPDPYDPHPRTPLRGPWGPRRGPHDTVPPPSPPRTRTPIVNPQRIRT